jgi:hypothetical protein
MRNLSALREVWDLDLDPKDEALQSGITSCQESLNQWMEMQTAFEWQLQQTAYLFEQDRRDALAELQARLRLLVD